MECIKNMVSIIIPCRNEVKYIGECIKSFLNQTYPQELLEIIVCDGLSNDGTGEIIDNFASKNENVIHLINKELTAPKGMNSGIKTSKGEYIIIFGAHAYADKNFVEKNIEMLQKNSMIGCAGGRIITINENKTGKAISLAMSSPFGVGNALFRYADKEMFVDTVAFGAYRKEILKQIGMFDEELVRNQDDELNYRVVKSGYKIILSPDIISYYYSRGSFKKVWKQYEQYGFWKVRVMQKHGKPAALRHLIPMLFVLSEVLGLAVGIFLRPILYLWLLENALYMLLDLFFSIKSVKKEISLLPAVFITAPILHLSYGFGFISGLYSFYINKSSKNVEKNSKMTR